MNYIINKRYLIILLLCFSLVSISVLNNYLMLHTNNNSINSGIALVNALYNVNDPLTLRNNHNKILCELVNNAVLNRISVQANGNRLFYTYYNLSGKNIKPIIKEATNSHIEFTLEIDGIEDKTLYGIWYKTKNKKIIEFNEAILLPFPS